MILIKVVIVFIFRVNKNIKRFLLYKIILKFLVLTYNRRYSLNFHTWEEFNLYDMKFDKIMCYIDIYHNIVFLACAFSFEYIIFEYSLRSLSEMFAYLVVDVNST